ncbi:Probable carotenoid cleavage dioxygenase 4-chloroplastic [Striga hermonthica]|uniref:Probable carotenoid cleavage dioxygenase 4-chloroplastic n=1 Tax=Striga hermonthica TaxID=68872 RepID=A0A9N7R1E4_STRHE|nr:Probable carotenoid cleavage dioxygenase 4-chloroplastic [Striga hermonthica]
MSSLFSSYSSYAKLPSKSSSSPSSPAAAGKNRNLTAAAAPNTARPPLAGVFRSIDGLICDFLDKKPLRPSVDPSLVLSGNFAPADELPPTPCHVAAGGPGRLPSCFHGGAYLLNGPSPRFPPRGPHHLFDGDGMVHAVSFFFEGPLFCSRHVRTYKYELEGRAGYPIVPSPFSSFNGFWASWARVMLGAARVLAGEFDPVGNGYGTANTSVAVIGGKLYALGENDLPYEIKVSPDGDITTIGRHDFHGGPDFPSMTAHPKTDPSTGETFAIRYNITQPRLTIFRIDPQGIKQPDVPIFSMNDTSLMHDFAVTENHVVVNDVQMVMSPHEILKGKPPTRVNLGKTPRLGFIGKHEKNGSGMWWVDVPGFNVSHVVNAWEEDDGGPTLVLVGMVMKSVEHAFERMDSTRVMMEEIRVSLTRRKVMTRRRLSTRVLDMPAINRAYVGKKTRYAYASQVAPSLVTSGVVKVDLSLSSDDCIVGSRTYGPSCTGNEPFFVPREPENPDSDEDDGYLVAYVHDCNARESKFLVMDAKSPTLEIVAVVELPGRVPSGFHGLFVSESELSKMC